MATRRREKKDENNVKQEPAKRVVPRWKVISGGITLLNKQSYAKGQTFEAEERDVPKAFRDIVQRITPVEESTPIRRKPKYKIQIIEATEEEKEASDFVQMFEVVDGQGKVISEEPLEEEEANELVKLLNQ